MSDLISIVVPIFNVEEYLERCISSILMQTYANIEVILVNDGSPDKCGDICDYYSKLDNRITVVHKENGGLSDARNVGLEISKGEYITFIDSDDWIHKEYISKLYELIKKTNSDISVCNFLRVSKDDFENKIIKDKIYEFTNIGALKQLQNEFYIQMVVAWGKLYKKILFDGIRFPVGRTHEDEFTTYKLLYKSKKVIFTTRPLLYYWQRHDSIMGNKLNLKRILDSILSRKERADFVYKIGIGDVSSKTYKAILINHIMLSKEINKLNECEEKALINLNIKKLKYDFRKCKCGIKLRIFYESYYIAPNIVCEVYLKYALFRKMVYYMVKKMTNDFKKRIWIQGQGGNQI